MDLNFGNDIIDTDFDELVFKINIRVQQRNGRKSWTMVEGLENIKDIDLKKFNKFIKKSLCCNGSIKKSDVNNEKILQFQGDHREDIKKIIIQQFQISEENIIIHGF